MHPTGSFETEDSTSFPAGNACERLRRDSSGDRDAVNADATSELRSDRRVEIISALGSLGRKRKLLEVRQDRLLDARGVIEEGRVAVADHRQEARVAQLRGEPPGPRVRCRGVVGCAD